MVRAVKLSEIQGKRNANTGIRVVNSRHKNKAQLRSHQVVLVAVLLMIFMGSGIGYVWSNFEGTQIGYDISKLQQEELRLKELNQKLRLELATLKSPQHLQGAARHLGLRSPTPEQIVILP